MEEKVMETYYAHAKSVSPEQAVTSFVGYVEQITKLKDDERKIKVTSYNAVKQNFETFVIYVESSITNTRTGKIDQGDILCFKCEKHNKALYVVDTIKITNQYDKVKARLTLSSHPGFGITCIG